MTAFAPWEHPGTGWPCLVPALPIASSRRVQLGATSSSASCMGSDMADRGGRERRGGGGGGGGGGGVWFPDGKPKGTFAKGKKSQREDPSSKKKKAKRKKKGISR